MAYNACQGIHYYGSHGRKSRAFESFKVMLDPFNTCHAVHKSRIDIIAFPFIETVRIPFVHSSSRSQYRQELSDSLRPRFRRVWKQHKSTPQTAPGTRWPSSTTMDRIEEFITPIRRFLEAHPTHMFVALLLGFSVYHWNASRVGCMICATT